jgi:TetR/AcrR family tetracycline transcriptional repressor
LNQRVNAVDTSDDSQQDGLAMATDTTAPTPGDTGRRSGSRGDTVTRVELSRARILDAAQAVVEREGDNALTFRRLGAELGADPTAAYRYFRNKDELLLALGDRLFGEAVEATNAAVPGDADWRTRFRLAGHGIRNTLVRHPKLATVISVRVTQGEHEALGIEQGLAILTAQGLPIREAVGVQRAFADTILAWSMFSATYEALPAEAKARDLAAWTTTYQSLPPQDFPHIHAGRQHLDEFDDAFDLALDLMFDGVQARIDAHKASTAANEPTAPTPPTDDQPHP